MTGPPRWRFGVTVLVRQLPTGAKELAEAHYARDVGPRCDVVSPYGMLNVRGRASHSNPKRESASGKWDEGGKLQGNKQTKKKKKQNEKTTKNYAKKLLKNNNKITKKQKKKKKKRNKKKKKKRKKKKKKKKN